MLLVEIGTFTYWETIKMPSNIFVAILYTLPPQASKYQVEECPHRQALQVVPRMMQKKMACLRKILQSLKGRLERKTKRYVDFIVNYL